MTCFLDVAGLSALSLSSTVALGINLVSWKISHVELSIIYGRIHAHWQMTDSMSRFSLFLKTNGIFLFPTYLGSISRLESVLLLASLTKDLQEGSVDQGMPMGVAWHQR